MKRGIWFVLGILLVWAVFRLSTNPSSPTVAKSASRPESPQMAQQDHKDHIASVVWRQSLVEKSTVVLALNNRSGMDVYVKVVSLDIPNAAMAVNVPDDSTVRVECPEGRFFLKMRYRSEQGYTYQKGEDFSLSKGGATEITLHKTPMGNYGSASMAASEF